MATKKAAQEVESIDVERLAEVIKLFGNATRLRLLWAIDGEKNVETLAAECGVSISAISQHLNKLRAYSLVGMRRDSQQMIYSKTGEMKRSIDALETYLFT